MLKATKLDANNNASYVTHVAESLACHVLQPSLMLVMDHDGHNRGDATFCLHLDSDFVMKGKVAQRPARHDLQLKVILVVHHCLENRNIAAGCLDLDAAD